MNILSCTQKSDLFFKEVFPSYSGFILSRAIYAITKLKVAEALSSGPLTLSELAKRLQLPYASQLERLLNFLASKSIFAKSEDGYFSHTKLSEDLVWEKFGTRLIKHQDLRWSALAEANEASVRALEDENDSPTEIERLSCLYVQSRAIYVACGLHVFEKLQKGEPVNQVLLRHLEQASLVTEKGLTQTGELFLDKNCQAFVLHDNSERWNALGQLEDAITQNVIPFEQQMGASFFEYISKQPETTRLFADAMTFVSEHECATLVPSLKEVLKPGTTIADIGGGKGRYLQEILQSYPEINGILFDLPENISYPVLDENTSRRCRFVGGSFFEQVPQADLFLFKRVLHDWGDEECIAILKQCAKAALPHTQLVLHEMLLPQPEALMFDIQFMSCIKGQQRTVDDFSRLLTASGWKLQSASKTGCWISQLVAELG